MGRLKVDIHSGIENFKMYSENVIIQIYGDFMGRTLAIYQKTYSFT